MDIKNIYANRLPKSSPKKEKEVIARKHGTVALLLKLGLLVIRVLSKESEGEEPLGIDLG